MRFVRLRTARYTLFDRLCLTAMSRFATKMGGAASEDLPGQLLRPAYKFAAHHVTYGEAVECFFNGFEVRANKSFQDPYKLCGRSNGGRKLLIVFQSKPGNVVRIITGWPI